MNLSETWKLHGNLKRIEEMDAAGVSIYEMARVFRDHDIRISERQITTIMAAVPELTRKALPKKAAQNIMADATERSIQKYCCKA